MSPPKDRTAGIAPTGWTTTLTRMTSGWDDAEVGQVGSALAAWSHLAPADLFGQSADDHPAVVAARADIARWRAASYQFLTFMDEAYPARLRDVLQMPPVALCLGNPDRE